MIAFDTNHLVRHIVQDDLEQSKAVMAMIRREAAEDRPIRLFDLVLLETAWVLQSVYGFERAAWAQVLEELLDDSAFNFDDAVRLRAVLKKYRTGKADFADYLIIAYAEAEGLDFKTFDKKLLKEIR